MDICLLTPPVSEYLFLKKHTEQSINQKGGERRQTKDLGRGTASHILKSITSNSKLCCLIFLFSFPLFPMRKRLCQNIQVFQKSNQFNIFPNTKFNWKSKLFCIIKKIILKTIYILIRTLISFL